MTREECELSIVYLEGIKDNYIEGNGYERHPLPEYYAIETAIKALEQKPETVTDFADRCKECGAKYGKLLEQYKAFAEWIAREVFSDDWEYNKDSFAEVACRKLANLGIVRAKGDEWELVELQTESEEEE